MDDDEENKKFRARSREIAVAAIPHIDAIQQILGPRSQLSLVAIFEHDDGTMSDFILGNGNFIEAAYILLKSELNSPRVEGVIESYPEGNDNNVKH